MTKQILDYLVIDWGTTNFRAFAMDASDTLVDTKSLPLGLLQVKNGAFAETLAKILNDWEIPYQDLPIYMAGMVGSAKGWVDVAYASAPADSHSLSSNAHSFILPWGAKAFILPGVSYVYEDDKYDVMRGEEIQILGVAELKSSANFHAILPGTHSKHVEFKDGKIDRFSSFLTGEFFSIITQHSILGIGLPEAESDKLEAFEKGVMDAQKGQLTNFIFLARTRRLFDQIEDVDVKAYISGLLIGYELRMVETKFIYIVGGQALSEKYKLACDLLNIKSEELEGNSCFLAGMLLLRRKLK